MKHLSAGFLAFLVNCLKWLAQKSSVAGYLSIITAVIAKQYAGDVANVAALISATAGVILFVLSDKQIAAMITGQPQTSREPVKVPEPLAPVNDPSEPKP